MASQRVSVVKIGGVAARTVADLFRQWERARLKNEENDLDYPTEIQVAVDAFASKLRAHSAEPPIVYFSEWIDTWSMGDLVPRLGANER